MTARGAWWCVGAEMISESIEGVGYKKGRPWGVDWVSDIRGQTYSVLN